MFDFEGSVLHKIYANEILCLLDGRDRDIVFKFFVLEMELSDIGIEYGFGTERARQLVARGIRKIRECLEFDSKYLWPWH